MVSAELRSSGRPAGLRRAFGVARAWHASLLCLAPSRAAFASCSHASARSTCRTRSRHCVRPSQATTSPAHQRRLAPATLHSITRATVLACAIGPFASPIQLDHHERAYSLSQVAAAAAPLPKSRTRRCAAASTHPPRRALQRSATAPRRPHESSLITAHAAAQQTPTYPPHTVSVTPPLPIASLFSSLSASRLQPGHALATPSSRLAALLAVRAGGSVRWLARRRQVREGAVRQAAPRAARGVQP